MEAIKAELARKAEAERVKAEAERVKAEAWTRAKAVLEAELEKSLWDVFMEDPWPTVLYAVAVGAVVFFTLTAILS